MRYEPTDFSSPQRDAPDARIIDRARRPGPWLVTQALYPLHDKPPAPLADCRFDHTKLRSYFLVLATFRTGQNDPGSQRQGLGRLAAAR
jgi:hypothetical protein